MTDQPNKLLIELVQSQAEATATLKHLVSRIDQIATDKDRAHDELSAQAAENARRIDVLESQRDRAIGWIFGAGLAGGIAGSGLVGLARAVTVGFVSGLVGPMALWAVSMIAPIPKLF